MASTKKITLRSSDGEIFEVEESVAVKSQMLKHMIDDNCAESVIPIPNVTSKVLAKVIEYCKKHVEANTAEEKPSDYELKSWDADFIKVDRATLFDLLLAANYLEIQSLMDFTVQTAADLIKEMTPEEVRKMFSIKNDFTLEEEERLRRDNKWAFQ